jgi:hypothetical protein
MSLFDLIRYPVDSNTADFSHLPDDIWCKYIEAHKKLDYAGTRKEKTTNALLIKTILEHDE